jgi:putative acetyltransferase
MTTFVLRPIQARDDAAIAEIIRAVMPEFGASGPGFAILDPEVDAMSAAYPPPRAIYLVVEVEGRVLGGGGIGPLAGADATTCELRKMYFLPDARGLGAGRALLARCIDEAIARKYKRMYLETLTGMDTAQRLYDRFGFKKLPAPIGATGHFGCDRWYALDLE